MENFDHLTLNQVDPSLGCEKSRKIHDNDDASVYFCILPSPDLVINQPVDFELYIVLGHPINPGVSAYCHDESVKEQLKEYLIARNEINLKSMIGTKYSLSAWFFAVRDLLKREEKHQWKASIRVRPEFRNFLNKRDISEIEKERKLFFSGSGQSRGRRPKMEDMYETIDFKKINEKNIVSLYSILDGHGGDECAKKGIKEIPERFYNLISENPEISYPDAIFQALQDFDQNFIKNSEFDKCGSTAVLSVFHQQANKFYFANIGDTRAVLSRAKLSFDLTLDRKATDPEEVVRISKAGGFVNIARLMGVIAVSRALGDGFYKKDPKKRILISDPEITCFSPDVDDEFLLMASDGLWDVLDSQTAIDYTRDLLIRNKLLESDVELSVEDTLIALNTVANCVAMHATTALKSLDNVSVIIILLNKGKDGLIGDTCKKGDFDVEKRSINEKGIHENHAEKMFQLRRILNMKRPADRQYLSTNDRHSTNLRSLDFTEKEDQVLQPSIVSNRRK